MKKDHLGIERGGLFFSGSGDRLALPLRADTVALVATDRGIEWLAVAPATVVGHTHVADHGFAATLAVRAVCAGQRLAYL
ncbi:hypothetical protein UI24_17095 [Mycobacteroides franklinii]|nr:hypothetical protein [Mycobacteroides franklinii]